MYGGEILNDIIVKKIIYMLNIKWRVYGRSFKNDEYFS